MRTPILLHFTTLTLTITITATFALQNIYIGTRDMCSTGAKYGPNWFVWFSDAPQCSGTDGGPTHYPGSTLCNKDIEILGHDGITFTGCPPAVPYGYPGAPTGVSDGGIPALNCRPVNAGDGGPGEGLCPNGGCGDMKTVTLYICEGLEHGGGGSGDGDGGNPGDPGTCGK